MRNARFMVTFAELALEDIKIPYTTNKIERLMGEIVLIRYTDEPLYNQFKNAYIHNRAFTKTGTAQKANLRLCSTKYLNFMREKELVIQHKKS